MNNVRCTRTDRERFMCQKCEERPLEPKNEVNFDILFKQHLSISVNAINSTLFSIFPGKETTKECGMLN